MWLLKLIYGCAAAYHAAWRSNLEAPTRREAICKAVQRDLSNSQLP